MNIKFEIADQELNHDQIELLKNILKLTNIADVSDAVSKISKAAIIEYLNMLVEGGMPHRVDEARQDRLFFLIKHYFDNKLPNESLISAIFQLPASQSKTLLKNTISRYRTKIINELKLTMQHVISTASHDNEKYLSIIESETIKDELNMIIVQRQPTFSPIVKKKGSACQYEISEDSYILLKSELGL